MRNPRELMQRHIDALYSRDSHGDLVRVNEPDGVPAPRFSFGTTVEGAVWRFRHDVDRTTRRQLEAALEHLERYAEAAPIDAAPYQAILARVAPVQRTWGGPAFSFPEALPSNPGTVLVTEANEALLRLHLAAWIPDVRTGQPLVAMVVDGHAVAVCGSVRQTSSAHEAGVETIPAHRRRGYATQVVAEWARAVRALGVEPLYSTSWENAESRATARTLGLLCFGSDVHIT